MKNLNKWITGIIFFVLSVSSLTAQSNVTITVTNSNMGLVREDRSLDMQKGVHTVNLVDIPSQIIAASVLIESPGRSFTVLEQNYEYDLIDVGKILKKTQGAQILVAHPDQGTVTGKLLSASSANLMLLDSEDNLQIIPRSKDQKIYLKEYSKRKNPFIIKPTLVWKVNTAKSGRQKALISYLSRGLNWQADYVGKLNDDDTRLTLACWVTVNNTSGKSFKDTRLKLMAGDLNILKKKERGRQMMAVEAMAAKPAFEEKAFFEYHLYTMDRPTDLGNNQVKQIQLFPETSSQVKKTYQVNSHNAAEVWVNVSFENSTKNNLGIPLPAGDIRLYKTDDKDLEFIGENKLKHTPKDEKIDIRVGKAFDVVSERQVLKSTRPSKRSRQQRVEYKIRNHKDKSIDVEIIETLNAYQETKLIDSSIEPVETRSDRFKFIVPVKANRESTLTMEYITSW